METAYVTLIKKDAIGYIEFYNPKHNALPSTLLKQLTAIIKKADADSNIKVIVLKSGGDRTFCAGASFTELVSIKNETAGKTFFMGFANVINAMRSCKKIIIGRVQGKAVGGGVGLACATDYCLATTYAQIKLSELSIGIGPFVIEPAVSRKMGSAALTEMTLNATAFFSPEYATQHGLFVKVYDTIETLDDATHKLACKLASYNPEALSKMKRIFWKNTSHWNTLLAERAEISGALVLSDFTKDKLKQFL